MEVWWALLLCLALLDKRARPLAALTAAVGMMNYAAVYLALHRVPVVIDVVSGVIAAGMVDRLSTARMRAFSAALVIAPLVHAWHWLLWDAGNANDGVRFAYYTLLTLLFSVKVLSLSWPGVCSLVGIVSDSLVRSGRFALGRLAPIPRLRPRNPR